MMFEREHHRKILTVLNSLNANFLADCGAYFGGGTLISLRHGEYRLSEDIDFMCSFDKKYARLREEVRNRGQQVRFKPGVRVKFPWRLTVGDYVWIGENAWLHNVAP